MNNFAEPDSVTDQHIENGVVCSQVAGRRNVRSVCPQEAAQSPRCPDPQSHNALSMEKALTCLGCLEHTGRFLSLPRIWLEFDTPTLSPLGACMPLHAQNAATLPVPPRSRKGCWWKHVLLHSFCSVVCPSRKPHRFVTRCMLEPPTKSLA